LAALFLVLNFPGASEAALSGGRPAIAVFPVVNNSSQRSGRLAIELIETKLTTKFAGRYTVLSGQTLADYLRREGVDDYNAVDSATLLEALRRVGVDYSIRAELQYVSLTQKVELPSALILMKSWIATVPLFINVTDVNQGVALYDATIVESGKHQSFIGFAQQQNAVRNATEQILDRIDREIILP
jgi:hypothetical protein